MTDLSGRETLVRITGKFTILLSFYILQKAFDNRHHYSVYWILISYNSLDGFDMCENWLQVE